MSKQERRHIYKQWRNGPEARATTRITWYHLEDGSDIRLILCDTRTTHEIYPETVEEAERIFNLFRVHSPRWFDLTTDPTPAGTVVIRVLDYLRQHPTVESSVSEFLSAKPIPPSVSAREKSRGDDSKEVNRGTSD